MIQPDEQTNSVAERLRAVQARIAAAAARAGRGADEVTLVAVGKTHPAATLRAALAAGQRVFGENRVQEALAKMKALAGPAAGGEEEEEEAAGAAPPIRWHLIGHVQTNKAADVAGRFELIHSVDSPRLVEALEARAARLGVRQPILLQVNVSGEASKFGAAPEGLPALLAALAAAPHLRGEGLMTIPPYDKDPEASRPHFARLRELLATLPPAPHFTPRHLSMGMSGDYEIAIEEGATLVRVGTAIFGERG